MMTSRTHKEHSIKWQPSAAMYAIVCSLGLSFVPVSMVTKNFGGKLRPETSIDSRQIRQ